MPGSATQIAEPQTRQLSRRRRPAASRNDEPATVGQEIAWAEEIPAEQWAIYKQAIPATRRAGIHSLIGGGFGLAAYTGRWRNTKDMDLYIMPGDRGRMIQVLGEAGFGDYHDTQPYDRGWIYRSTRDGTIVDVIWSMANRRAEVDPIWFQKAKSLMIRDEVVQLVSPEELLWCKLYVFQRDHCDWTDALNLIYAVGPWLDWDHLLERLANDLPVLRAALTFFGWLSPGRAAQIPENIRQRLGLPDDEQISPEEEESRIRLLDTRAWFAALQPKDKVLEV